jgi:hypothetical protein
VRARRVLTREHAEEGLVLEYEGLWQAVAKTATVLTVT